MSVTIGGLQIKNLMAPPYGYQSDDAALGLVARSWTVSGLLNTTELASFKGVYETWYGNRIDDGDTIATNSVGSTVSLSFSANGLSASGVSCWFTSVPVYRQIGAYVELSVDLVDANQALTVAKKKLQKESNARAGLRPDLSTVTLGNVVITLLEPMERLDDLPTLERTAGGHPYISGPMRSSAVREIRGTVANEAAVTTLRNWVATTVQSAPSTGDWYPTTAPVASVETRVVGGVVSKEWTVDLTVEQV